MFLQYVYKIGLPFTLTLPRDHRRGLLIAFSNEHSALDHRSVFYTPPHFSGEVLCYTLRCLSVCPSVRAHHFRSITWVFIHGIFSNFAYILLSAMSGMGLLMGKIRPFLTELLPFSVLEKWFMACYSFTVHDIWMKLHRYVAHQRLHIVTKDCHSDLPSLWVIRPW